MRGRMGICFSLLLLNPASHSCFSLFNLLDTLHKTKVRSRNEKQIPIIPLIFLLLTHLRGDLEGRSSTNLKWEKKGKTNWSSQNWSPNTDTPKLIPQNWYPKKLVGYQFWVISFFYVAFMTNNNWYPKTDIPKSLWDISFGVSVFLCSVYEEKQTDTPTLISLKLFGVSV
jgi:hypothetical protein